MKLNIVQAVKLGTVACLLAVTTQTIAIGIILGDNRTVCKDNKAAHWEYTESGMADGHKWSKTFKGHCDNPSHNNKGGRIKEGGGEVGTVGQWGCNSPTCGVWEGSTGENTASEERQEPRVLNEPYFNP